MSDTKKSKVIFLTDRSAVEADDKCGMKYWWNRKEGGKGIVPKDEPLALILGRQVHEDLATVAQMEDISDLALRDMIQPILDQLTDDDKLHQDKLELLYRRLGWVVAFAQFIEPEIRRKYDTLQVEGELILDREPLWVACTPDRVLRNKETGSIEYREYKTTISTSGKWINSWPFAIQLHISLAALEEELGAKVHFAQIQALAKGYNSQTDGRLMHPYVWAYYNSRTDSWTSDSLKARGADWEPMPVWEYAGGLVEWVRSLGRDVALSQFPLSPPVFLNRIMLDKWVARRVYREKVISEVEATCQEDKLIRAIYFEQRTNQCRPPFGDACPYLSCCWNATIEEDPLRNGEFVPREPHHEVELTLEDN